MLVLVECSVTSSVTIPWFKKIFQPVQMLYP